jgi:hypothetical protein
MSRKLILLNVALLGIVVYAGVMLRNEMQSAKAREARMHAAKVQTMPPAPLNPLPQQQPVVATGYKDVAMKTLFHPSRNPDLPPPPPPPAPPPPPPIPPLPKYHGTMNIFGDGPQALLSLNSLPTTPVSIGESIGAFKLVDLNTVDITFDYQGTILRRTLAQLTDRTITASSGSGSGGGGNEGRSVSAPPPMPAAAPLIQQPVGPVGEATSFGFKTCAPNESLPDGTIQGGYRKVSYNTPFGKACRWDPVGR